MPKATSPLRYPGGKTCLLPIVSRIVKLNDLCRKPYAEPFAGGCGLALSLLYGGYVSEIHVNDVDPSIWAFWYSVLNNTDEFCERIKTIEISIDEWKHQKSIRVKQDTSDPVTLGFSTFFLNRTNRSGIIKNAGVIGGLKQSGHYKMDCRFNKDELTRRIRRIEKYKKRIHLTKLDALDFLRETKKNISPETFLCIDPPYFNKGEGLYTSYYKPNDHTVLSKEILNLENPWIVTYDNTYEISSLYRDNKQYHFDVNYSVRTKRKATELLISSQGLAMPPEIHDRHVPLDMWTAA